MSMLVALGAFILSALITRHLLNPDSVLTVLDHPNERSLHDSPVPTGGGVAIAASVFGMLGGIFYLVADTYALIPIGAAAVLVLGVSFADDRSPLSPSIRIAVHFLAATILVATGLSLGSLVLPNWHWQWPAMLAAGFSVLYVVWMINLYNFMDGMDGFAGGMGVIGFATLAILGYQSGHSGFALSSAAIAGASAGFTVFNFPPARIFMGDVGASMLGLLAAAFTLWGDKIDAFPWWVGVLVFSVFVVDATFTLLRRLLNQETVWRAHKTHFYQRLVQVGWGHRRTVLWEYALMILCAISAIISMRVGTSAQSLLLWGWGLTYTMLMVIVHRLDSNHRLNQ